VGRRRQGFDGRNNLHRAAVVRVAEFAFGSTKDAYFARQGVASAGVPFMSGLVADIGGTNTRLALARDGVVDAASILRYSNDDYPAFLELVHAYLADTGNPPITKAAIAMAGPVSAKGARLTNRDWWVDVGMMSPVTQGGPVRFLNDLKALGFALNGMKDGELAPILPVPDGHVGNSQSLVIGIGTGFNVSPVLRENNRTTCLDAEFGHTGLPASVASHLKTLIGEQAGRFETVEHCFSGRGLAAIRQAAGAQGHKAACIQDTYARMMSALARELVLAFMPLDGLFFAGSVARAVLETESCLVFAETFSQPHALRSDLSAVPVGLITNDFAPLNGCAEYLRRFE
jgi:glucokinase